MAILGVNIDHVATLRQARREQDPDPVLAARICEESGAKSIVAHLREDRRHIQDRDVLVLRRTVKTRFNLEMSLNPDIVAMAIKIKPDQVTIVPERRKELTTEGGLDVIKHSKAIIKACEILRRSKIDISLFIDPNRDQIIASRDIGIRIIEIHTGQYARNYAQHSGFADLKKIQSMTSYAVKHGFVVNAGHGLNYDNVRPIAKIDGINELNIGHSIIARSLFVGFKKAVNEMRILIQ